MEIRDLEPKALWNNFYKLTQVPRPSHHMEAITKFMVNWGKEHGLETIVDPTGSVLLRKPATPGMENRTPVILQAHLDMVPQKETNKKHDFVTDPISAYIDGDWVTADGTTLGADDGIGVAAAMAVLESKELKHGPIEAFFTIDEETGMTGAFGMEQGLLKGDILLNLDSEDEGELYVGCAGGLDADMTWKFNAAPVPEDDIALEIVVKGLKGGHSGLEINCGRANANKLLFRVLKEAIMQYEARLASVEGGNMRNAIPREAHAIITIPAEGRDDIEKLCEEWAATFNDEYKATEDAILIDVNEVPVPEALIPEEIQDDFVNAITACPDGVFRMVPDVADTVETSTNLSIVTANSTDIAVKCLLRSSVDSRKEELASMMESVFALAGAKVEFSGSYSGWAPDMKSPILKTMADVYQKEFGKPAVVRVVHAGLECGIIGATEPRLDMVSFGPTIRHPHTSNEKVHIGSIERFWRLIAATLEAIPVKG